VVISRRDIARLFVAALLLVLLLRAFEALAGVLLLFVGIIVAAMVISGPVTWLERRGVPRMSATAMVATLLLITLVAVVRFLGLPLITEATAYLEQLPSRWANLAAWLSDLSARFPILAGVSESLQHSLDDISASARRGLVSGELARQVMDRFTVAAVAVVTTLFTVAVPRPLLVGVLSAAPEPFRLPLARALCAMGRQMRVWVGASAFVGLVDGIAVFIGLTVLGVQPAPALAALVFIGEFVPYIGPIVAAIPAVFLALLQSPLTALWTLLLYFVVQQLESNILHPIVVARGMHFHPLSVTFSILALGTLFGLPGAFLAIPALAAIKALHEEFRAKPDATETTQIQRLADAVMERDGAGAEG
jgi:predicted PurR-regulated permease PerM